MSACIPEAYFCSPLYLPICIYDGAMRLRALFFSPLPAEKEVAPAYVAHGAPAAKQGVTVVFMFIIKSWSNM